MNNKMEKITFKQKLNAVLIILKKYKSQVSKVRDEEVKSYGFFIEDIFKQIEKYIEDFKTTEAEQKKIKKKLLIDKNIYLVKKDKNGKTVVLNDMDSPLINITKKGYLFITNGGYKTQLIKNEP